MEFRLLGPMEVLDRGTALALGGLKQRALLARLLVTPNRTVAVDRLVDDLWGEAAPDTATKMVQIYVSQLRKAAPGAMCSSRARPATSSRSTRRRSTSAASIGCAARAARRSRRATRRPPPRGCARRWGSGAARRSPSSPSPSRRLERDRLDELRLACLEDRIEADLVQGRHAELVGELAAEVARFPLRERLRRQSMLALYRSGRHADALAVYEDFRRRSTTISASSRRSSCVSCRP